MIEDEDGESKASCLRAASLVIIYLEILAVASKRVQHPHER